MKHKDFMDKVVKHNLKEGAICLPLQQEKLGSKINITKGMYLLLGGIPGSGKTAIVDTVFVLELFDWWRKNKKTAKIKPKWIYRSMERSREYKRAKWLCYKLYKDHKVLIDVPTMLNFSTKSFDLKDYPKIIELMDSYDKYFDELFDNCELIAGAENPTGIYKYIKDYALRNGEVLYEDKVIVDEKGRKKTIKLFKKYISNNPNEIVLHITDHVGKIKRERGYNYKETLDKHSEYMSQEARDKYEMIPIDVSQLNRGILDYNRNLKTDLEVQPDDFKGTSNIYEDADVVLGLMNPYKLNNLTHAGYNIQKFVNDNGYNRFRSLKILKNSYGIDDVVISYNFIGENGIMKEIPPSSEFLKNPEYYDYCANIRNNNKEYYEKK